MDQTRKLSDLERMIQQAQLAGQAWVEAKAKALQLKEGAPIVLADLMNTIQLEQRDKPLSETALKRAALARPEYRQYIKGMVEARKQSDSLEVRYKNMERMIDARRTQHVTERERDKHQKHL